MYRKEERSVGEVSSGGKKKKHVRYRTCRCTVNRETTGPIGWEDWV